MFDNRHTIKYLTEKDEAELIARCTKTKYKLGALIMLDCGLRISELRELKIKDINWQKKEMYVCSLKTRAKNKDGSKRQVWRVVILTDRIIQCAANYFLENNKATKNSYVDTSNPNAYLFPSTEARTKGQPISRMQFWRYYDAISDGRAYNHIMRHTFGMKSLAAGVDIFEIKEALGHVSVKTTEMYVHVTKERKHKAAVKLQTYQDTPVISLAKRWFPRLYKVKNVHVLPTQTGWVKYHVGRKDELILLYSLIEKKVNVLVKGDQSVGKSHILAEIKGEKIMRIGDTKSFLKSLAGMLMYIVEGEGAVYDTKDITTSLDKETNTTSWEVESKPTNPKEVLLEMLDAKKEHIQKYSAKTLTDLMVKLTEKNEYTIIIDSVDHITPSVVTTLEFLRNHFHFIVAARNVKIEHATWLTNFQKVEIKPLTHAESVELIVRASEDFRENIQSFEIYKNHIINKCGGNPGFILELIDRFRKEEFVSKSMVADIDYVNNNKKEISMTPFILLVLALGMIAKYWSREATPVDYPMFAIIAAVAIVLGLFIRGWRSPMKRKYV